MQSNEAMTRAANRSKRVFFMVCPLDKFNMRVSRLTGFPSVNFRKCFKNPVRTHETIASISYGFCPLFFGLRYSSKAIATFNKRVDHCVTPLIEGESVQIQATRWNFGAPSNVQAIKLRPVCV